MAVSRTGRSGRPGRCPATGRTAGRPGPNRDRRCRHELPGGGGAGMDGLLHLEDRWGERDPVGDRGRLGGGDLLGGTGCRQGRCRAALDRRSGFDRPGRDRRRRRGGMSACGADRGSQNRQAHHERQVWAHATPTSGTGGGHSLTLPPIRARRTPGAPLDRSHLLMPHHRKPVYAPRGVVATSQPLAASAGLDVLRRGGNAVDAALATAITLTVVQPGANDLGGDLFAIVWDGAALHGLNASGRSPAALTLDVARRAAGGSPALPARGWLPVTVPGAPAGWRDLHARFGRLPFADLFADAIGYAADGYPVSPRAAYHWQRSVEIHAGLVGPEFAEWGAVYAVDGRAPAAGETVRNPAKAR